ncbi:MAG TPA: MFS transporter [Candidatus Limnocylindrales bacterium]|nr:MFS transporter [Candidatus Limnocylindrales bacterium]
MRNADFRRFWFGQTVSLFGSQVTFLALPLTAILVLQASPLEMGVLAAVEWAPFLFLTLPAGAWVDRVRRRPVLIAANLVRAALLGVVPIAALLGVLSYPLLLVVALAVGLAAVFFEVAFPAYVPSLVGREALAGANARIFASASSAEVVGPGAGGVLVSLVGAPLALAADALSYLVAGLSLVGIRRDEALPEAPGRRDLRAEIVEGLRATFGHPILRVFAFEAATFNLFVNALNAAFLLFLTRELGLSPAVVGIVFAVAALGSLGGSLAAGRLGTRFGLGPTIVSAMVIACGVYLAIPVLPTSPSAAAVMLALVLAVAGAFVAITVIHVITIRQSITEDRLLARMNASYRTLAYGMVPIGAVLGGVVGELFGLRAAILVGCVGIALAPLWVVLSPVWRIRTIADVPRVGEGRATFGPPDRRSPSVSPGLG